MRSTPSLLLSAALLASAAGCGDDDADAVPTIPYQDDGKLTVMTRNLYLGADLTPVIQAGTDPTAFVTATTQTWNVVQLNRFDLRADSLADEIRAALPDVVGLQEVSLWRTQNPGDAAGGNLVPNAAGVAIDYLDILLFKLRERGLSYVPAQVLELFDVEVPVAPVPGGQDVRLTDRQVILVREGVPFVADDDGKGVFPDPLLLPLPVFGATLPVKRGWTRVQVTVGGKDLVVYDTHLEAFNDQARDGQAQFLATLLSAEPFPVVLLGDLNSRPDENAYLLMLQAGFTDAWTAAGEGLTCCFAPLLTQPRSVVDLDERIDYVLLRPLGTALAAERVEVVGEEDADRAPWGLWPSDHAGVVADLAP